MESIGEGVGRELATSGQAPRMVCVCWLDAAIDTERAIGDQDLPEPIEVHSVGYLSRQTKDRIVVSREHTPSSAKPWRGAIAIPVGMVRELVTLEPVEQGLDRSGS